MFFCWGQERRSRARADAGAVGPGRGLREERAGRLGAAAAGRERVGAAGGGGAAAAAGSSFVPAAAPSVAGTRRSSGSGRREAGGGAEEEAEGGPQAARLTLLAALARRHLTPPPAAGRADSEGERPVRCEAWAPRGPADGALRRFCYRRGSCAALRSERSPSRDAHGSALQPTDALSPPGAWAVRERGGQGRSLCVSENPDDGGGQRDDVTFPTPRPRPQSQSEKRGGACRRFCRAEPSHRPGCRPRGGAGKSESCGGCVSIFTRLSALCLPPSDFLTQARFWPSEFSRFVSSPRQTFPFPP